MDGSAKLSGRLLPRALLLAVRRNAGFVFNSGRRWQPDVGGGVRQEEVVVEDEERREGLSFMARPGRREGERRSSSHRQRGQSIIGDEAGGAV